MITEGALNTNIRGRYASMSLGELFDEVPDKVAIWTKLRDRKDRDFVNTSHARMLEELEIFRQVLAERSFPDGELEARKLRLQLAEVRGSLMLEHILNTCADFSQLVTFLSQNPEMLAAVKPVREEDKQVKFYSPKVHIRLAQRVQRQYEAYGTQALEFAKFEPLDQAIEATGDEELDTTALDDLLRSKLIAKKMHVGYHPTLLRLLSVEPIEPCRAAVAAMEQLNSAKSLAEIIRNFSGDGEKYLRMRLPLVERETKKVTTMHDLLLDWKHRIHALRSVPVDDSADLSDALIKQIADGIPSVVRDKFNSIITYERNLQLRKKLFSAS